MSTLIIIPAYNEEETIGKVIDAVKVQAPHILVVNDGSKDATAAIARSHGVMVKTHVLNRGLGAALCTGFTYAITQKFDCVITLDADGQHDPEDIPRLIEKLNEGHDVVIGSRMIRTEGMPTMRVIANKIANLVTSGGHITTDSQSGLRAIKVHALKKLQLTSTTPPGMEISSQIIEEVHRNKLTFAEIPIKPVYTDYSMAKGQSFLVGLQTWWRLLMMRIFK